MEQRQKQTSKPKKHWERTKQVLASAAKSLKRVWAGRKLDRALEEAAKGGNIADTVRLLKAGASVKARDNDGWTALHWAAWSGCTQICALLLEKGASIKAKDKYNGWTALRNAKENKKTETAKFLAFAASMGKDSLRSFFSAFSECTASP